MKKCLLGVVVMASLSCGAVAQPLVAALTAHNKIDAKSTQNDCVLQVIGNTLTTLVNEGVKPLVSFETSESALSALSSLNNQNCASESISVQLNSQGLTQVSSSGFTTYDCWSKDDAAVVCAILTSNYDVA